MAEMTMKVLARRARWGRGVSCAHEASINEPFLEPTGWKASRDFRRPWLQTTANGLDFLLFHKVSGEGTVPGGAAIPGRCVERTERAPYSAPCSKNAFNMSPPHRGRIRY